MTPQDTIVDSPIITADPLSAIDEVCFRIDREWVIQYANPKGLIVLGRHTDPVLGASARALFPDAFGAVFDREVRRAFQTGTPAIFEEQCLPQSTWYEVRIHPDESGATVLAHDIAARRRSADLLEDQTRVLERIARGRPTRDVLEAVGALVERHTAGLLCGIYAVDPAVDRLRLTAGSSLPPDLLQAVETVDVKPAGPPVAKAAATLRDVILQDYLGEPADAPLRDVSTRNGLRASWAFPVAGSEGHLLGVLAAWRREAGAPDTTDDRVLRVACQLAGIALDQSQVESDLRQKEEQYRAIVETLQDALIVADVQGFVVEANPAACRLHGSPYEALIRRHATELVRVDYHGLLRRMLDDVRRGQEFRGELVCLRRDGDSFPAEITAAPFTFKGQRHLLAIVRDLTERNKMAASLRGSEERLRTVANAAPLALFSLDRNGVITLSEGLALASIGFRPGETVGKSVFDLYHHRPDILQNLRMVLSGEPRRWIGEVADRVFETTARPLRSPRGEIDGLVGVAVDITDQTMAQDAQRESEERFRAAFHDAPVGVALAGLDGSIQRANDRLLMMLGVGASDVTGHRLAEWYTDADGTADDAAIHALLTGDAPTFSAQRELRHTDGSATEVVVSVSMVRGRQREPRQVIFAVTAVG